MNYQVVVPPILLWAGLGEMCRIGDIVLNPSLGPRFKAAVVTTDLPLEVDKHIDVEKCTGMRVGNQYGSGCGTCIKVCPWNKPYTPFHRTVSWAMQKIPPMRRFGVWGVDLLGYGKPGPRWRWWLDVEEIDGEFLPATSRKIRRKR